MSYKIKDTSYENRYWPATALYPNGIIFKDRTTALAAIRAIDKACLANIDKLDFDVVNLIVVQV